MEAGKRVPEGDLNGHTCPVDDVPVKGHTNRRFCSAKCKDRAKKIKTYGITVNRWRELLESQDGKCFLCGKAEFRNLAIDHDHNSGAVRGLLCSDCNYRVLPAVGDRPEAFLNLWAYAVRPPAQVPRVTDHAFVTLEGLVQCVQVMGTWGTAYRCGRLENEHA